MPMWQSEIYKVKTEENDSQAMYLRYEVVTDGRVTMGVQDQGGDKKLLLGLNDSLNLDRVTASIGSFTALRASSTSFNILWVNSMTDMWAEARAHSNLIVSGDLYVYGAKNASVMPRELDRLKEIGTIPTRAVESPFKSWIIDVIDVEGREAEADMPIEFLLSVNPETIRVIGAKSYEVDGDKIRLRFDDGGRHTVILVGRRWDIHANEVLALKMFHKEVVA